METKIKSMEEAISLRRSLARAGKRVVFTNGCFDILHPGHVRYLAQARGLGDHLFIGLNSDRSVRTIKGSRRPIFLENARAELLGALSMVDTVVIFDEETPARLIGRLLPDLLVKGGDWREDTIVGAQAVKASGGAVQVIPFEKGFSTTSIIEEILRRYA